MAGAVIVDVDWFCTCCGEVLCSIEKMDFNDGLCDACGESCSDEIDWHEDVYASPAGGRATAT